LVQTSIKAIKPKVQPEIAPAAIKFYRPAETSAIDPQKAIQEENQKAISKIMGSDKKSLQDFTFDLEGRVIPLVEPNWKRNTG
jgi:Holliday junction resolvasome RuvABC DNA-binding subunit